ncbi:tRNA nucleotidyltransferase [Burkholderia pseudomallei]|nr:hypothetical protein BURPS668_3256 [Burkholderia pseudomallei 668]ACQ95020.1 conserved hypothetical protein [Burkholderia pseudomallei MSHR346]AFR17184.1 hypothetical protein BPC006_I3339 [Burkholderia pseudomallei BPC006]ARK49736.1 tRNA nucleotidyltransferase [Burkholderia pseudomallei]EBA48184.1 tRNA nucleotidyltransferase/poly [Burkholderia pseudomallei 305]EEH29766.1 conserved hypothetical protein [Burkholderia pseudomallei Pakistan 9]EXJ00271.1 tRNA nucleotidyltransferase/poly [Burkho
MRDTQCHSADFPVYPNVLAVGVRRALWPLPAQDANRMQ